MWIHMDRERERDRHCYRYLDTDMIYRLANWQLDKHFGQKDLRIVEWIWSKYIICML
jgi:hypothetical protein